MTIMHDFHEAQRGSEGTDVCAEAQVRYENNMCMIVYFLRLLQTLQTFTEPITTFLRVAKQHFCIRIIEQRIGDLGVPCPSASAPDLPCP